MGTIRVSPDTRRRLAGLKEHPGESYDRVINRLIDFYEDEELLTREDVEGIREALQELKEGKFFTHEQVKERLGLGEEKPFTLIYAPRAVKDLEELSRDESGSPPHAKAKDDEILAMKEYEMRKRGNSTQLNPL